MSKQRPARGSFRDRAGFVFEKDNVLYRQVEEAGKDDYEHLLSSGLYRTLADDQLMVSHTEVQLASFRKAGGAYKILKPERIPFISYPYEWSFSALRAAALLTLSLQKKASAYGMALKDASAYNVQFRGARPMWIDTLSFECTRADAPWVAYRQFCQHFLAPLALMRYKDVRLGKLLQHHIDGVPLDLASSMLPICTRLVPSLALHVHAHAKSEAHFGAAPLPRYKRHNSRFAAPAILDGLERAVMRLAPPDMHTPWQSYYDDAQSYSKQSFEHKQEIVEQCVARLNPAVVWDFGANDARLSRIASSCGAYTVAFDSDAGSVERAYQAAQKESNPDLLPLVMDIANPSPAVGWGHEERFSLRERGPADALLALALLHHLVIAQNIPLGRVASFFAQVGNALIIEFAEPEDPMVQKLLARHKPPLPVYSRDAFEEAFRAYFKMFHIQRIEGSQRVIYCMQKV